jgi:hypothetical protein
MVDAPYTGTVVRAEAFPDTPGASFGSLLFVGGTRPACRHAALSGRGGSA